MVSWQQQHNAVSALIDGDERAYGAVRYMQSLTASGNPEDDVETYILDAALLQEQPKQVTCQGRPWCAVPVQQSSPDGVGWRELTR